MQLWQLLQENTALSFIFFGLLGLCVGSFLNVVIYRIPLIMMQVWREGSVDILKQQPDIPHPLVKPIAKIVNNEKAISLSYPPSTCPNCSQRIRWFHNIPVVSWLALKGNCSACQHPISLLYPLVELATALATILVIYQFGVTIPALFALVLVWTLIALTGIDFNTQLLPDNLTLPLIALGLAVNSQGWFVTPVQAIWGALLGFLIFWIVSKIFYLITKKQGMGQGDFKLLAAIGAWLGPLMLPLIVLISSLLGSIVGLYLIKKNGESKPFAFGPFIAIAGIVCLLYGSAIMNWYLGQ